MKKYKVMVGDYVAYVDSVARAHSVIEWYLDLWFNNVGGMGTPTAKIIALTTGDFFA